jgi:hypothetical protein
VSPRDRLRDVAIPFAIDAVLALHPRVWRWANNGKRKALEIPVWKRVARAVVGGLLIALLFRYFERSAERLKAEDPELYARIRADARGRRR